MNRLSIQERAQILGLMVEVTSLRATSRLADVSINTVTKLLVDVGAACEEYQDRTLRGLKCKRIQCDEIWAFILRQGERTSPNSTVAPLDMAMCGLGRPCARTPSWCRPGPWGGGMAGPPASLLRT